MLFRDYGFPEGVVAMPGGNGQLSAKLDLLLGEASRARLAEQCRREAGRQRQASDTMWRDVFAVLRPQ